MSRAHDLLSLIRLSAFDITTEGGRSRERYRRAGLTAAVALAAKIVGVAAVFVTVPLTLNYLGTERYGLWMTISSVSLLLGFADLGIGNGVLNAIAHANGRDDRKLARQAVSSGFFLLALIGATLVAIFALVYTFVPWARVYNVTSADAMSEAGPATAVFVLVWALNIPVDIVQRVQLGYQKGFVNHAWQAVGGLFALAGAVLAIEAGAGLPWLVLALTGGPLLAVALNGAVEFGWIRPWLRPTWRYVEKAVAGRILRLGVWFFIIQLAMTLGYSSDYIVIAQVLGSPEVSQYAIPARLFAFVNVLVAMLVAPLWPAYGEAMARGDILWVKRALLRTLLLTFFFTAGSAAILVVFGQTIIDLWVGDTVHASYWLLIGLATWTLLTGLGSTVAIFLNGVSVLRFQAVCTILMSVTALGLKIVFAGWWGVAGVPWALVIAYAVFVVVPFVVYVPRLLRRLDSRSGGSSRLVWSDITAAEDPPLT